MFSTRKNRANESKEEKVSTEEWILGEEKNRRKKRKKSRRREGVESVGIPLKVVVKVVRLVAEEKTTRFGQRGTTHRSGNGGRRGRFVDVEGKVSRYVNRIKVDVENMLGSQTEPYTPSTYFIQFRCGIFISYFHGPASIQLRRSFDSHFTSRNLRV